MAVDLHPSSQQETGLQLKGGEGEKGRRGGGGERGKEGGEGEGGREKEGGGRWRREADVEESALKMVTVGYKATGDYRPTERETQCPGKIFVCGFSLSPFVYILQRRFRCLFHLGDACEPPPLLARFLFLVAVYKFVSSLIDILISVDTFCCLSNG